MGEIARLRDRDFNGYLRRRIPHPLDEVVSAVVSKYRDGDAHNRKAMVDAVTPRVAGVLNSYGERMAAMAVRTSLQDYLIKALLGMGMAISALEDRRDVFPALAAVNDSARRIDCQLSDLLGQIETLLPVDAAREFRAFTERRDRDKSLSAMGIGASGAGNEFRYVAHSCPPGFTDA